MLAGKIFSLAVLSPFPEQYFAGGNKVLAKGNRLLVLQRIKRILSFAKSN
jgi:hypothetical protein